MCLGPRRRHERMTWDSHLGFRPFIKDPWKESLKALNPKPKNPGRNPFKALSRNLILPTQTTTALHVFLVNATALNPNPKPLSPRP